MSDDMDTGTSEVAEVVHLTESTAELRLYVCIVTPIKALLDALH